MLMEVNKMWYTADTTSQSTPSHGTKLEAVGRYIARKFEASKADLEEIARHADEIADARRIMRPINRSESFQEQLQGCLLYTSPSPRD